MIPGICNKQHAQYPGGCFACLFEERDALAAEVQKLKAELEKVTEDLKWSRRNYEENEMLVSDYTNLRSLAQGMAEDLKRINKVGLDRTLGQIVGSEHYEKAWLDCVELAGRALAAWDAFEKGQK